MILVNTDYISGKTLETLSLVSGCKTVLTSVMDKKPLEHAIKDMTEEATKIGADAIVNIRYAPLKDCFYIYGTAVKFV